MAVPGRCRRAVPLRVTAGCPPAVTVSRLVDGPSSPPAEADGVVVAQYVGDDDRDQDGETVGHHVVDLQLSSGIQIDVCRPVRVDDLRIGPRGLPGTGLTIPVREDLPTRAGRFLADPVDDGLDQVIGVLAV